MTVLMKKQLLSFLLLPISIFSSHVPSSPSDNPTALCKLLNDTVMLGYFQKKPNRIFIRVQDEENKNKEYESSLDRKEALAALRKGTIVKLYKSQPTTDSVMPKLKFLTSRVEKAFQLKTSKQSVSVFCNKVENIYIRIQAQKRSL